MAAVAAASASGISSPPCANPAALRLSGETLKTARFHQTPYLQTTQKLLSVCGMWGFRLSPCRSLFPESLMNLCAVAVIRCHMQVRRMNDRIGRQLEFDGAITPRRFRTTVLTDLYDRTKDIKLAQSAAGHTTPAMCRKRYVKGRNNSSKAAAAAVDAVYSA